MKVNIRNWKSRIPFLLAGLVGTPFVLSAESANAQIEIAPLERKEPVDFEKEILPIFRKNCLACHNASDAEGDLVLETPDTIKKGGGSGAAVEPGKGADSLLLKISAHQEEPIMPPADNKVAAKNMTPQELGLLKLWIDQGATGTVTMANSVVFEKLPAGIHPVYALSVSNDGQLLTASRANQVYIYHIQSKREVARLTDPALIQSGLYQNAGVADLDLIQSLAFSPASGMIASGGYRTVKLWNQIAPKIGEAVIALPAAVSVTGSEVRGGKTLIGTADGQVHIVDGAARAISKSWKVGDSKVVGVANVSDTEIATACDDQTIRFWNADGSQSPRPAVTIGKPIAQLGFSVKLGKLVVACGDNVVRTYPLSAEALPNPAVHEKELPGHAAAVKQMVMVGDGTLAISADESGVARLWNLEAGNQVREFAHGAPLAGIALADSQKRLCTTGANGVARIWDLDNGQVVKESAGVYNRTIAAETADRVVALGKRQVELAKKDLEEANARKKAEEENLTKSKEAVEAAKKDFEAKKAVADKAAADLAPVAKDLEDKKAAATAMDAEVKKTDEALAQAATKRKELEEALKALQGDAVANKDKIDATNAEIAALDANKANLDKQKAELQAKLNELNAAIKPVEENHKKLADASKKAADDLTTADRAMQGANRSVERGMEAVTRATNAIPEFEAALKNREETVKTQEATAATSKKQVEESKKPVVGVTVADGGATFVIQLASGAIQGLNSLDGSPMFSLDGAAGEDVRLTISNGGTVIRTVGTNLQFVEANFAWDLAKSLGNPTGESQFSDRVTALDFNADGSMLAVGGGVPSRSGEIHLLDPKTGDTIRKFDEPHSDTVLSIRFSPDGTKIASSATDRFMKVFDVATGKWIRSFEGHTHHVQGVAWSSDGRTLVTSGADKAVKVWNAMTGEQLRTIQGFNKEVTGVDYLGLTANIVASAGDNLVHMKNADNAGNVKQLGGFADFVYCVDATPDGKLIAAGGHDSVIRVWKEDGQEFVKFELPK